MTGPAAMETRDADDAAATPLARALAAWARACGRRPRRVLAAALVAAALAGIAIARLRIDTGIELAVPTASGRTLERIEAAFGVREEDFLIAELPPEAASEDADAGRALLVRFARAVADALAGDDLVAEVSFGAGALAEQAYAALAPYGPRFCGAADADGAAPGDLLTARDARRRLERQLARLALPGAGGAAEKAVEADPFDLGGCLLERFRGMAGAYRFDPASPEFLSVDGRAILIRLRGSRSIEDTASARATVEAVEAAVASARRTIAPREVVVRTGGGHFLAAESERVIRADLIASLSLSSVCVVLLVIVTLRSSLEALAVLPPLALGLLLGIGLWAAAAQRLAAISLGGAAILIGLGVDFAVHLLLDAREGRAEGRSPVEAMARACGRAGPGLVLAALTTAVGFLTFLLASQSFLRDLGVITALGILTTLAATLTVLPALAPFVARSGGASPRRLGADRIAGAATRAPRATLAAGIAIAAIACVALAAAPPDLESDLRSVHARSSSALAAERRMVEVFGGSAEPILLLVESAPGEPIEPRLRAAAGALDGLVARGSLVAHISAAALLPDVAVERAVIERFAESDAAALATELRAALADAGFDAEALGPAAERAARAAVDAAPLGVDGLRGLGLGSWVDRLVGPCPEVPGARVAIAMLFPPRGIWTAAERRRILGAASAALRDAGVEPQLTGLIAVSLDASARILGELARMGGLAFLAAAAMVAVLFRSARATALALAPVTLACLVTAACFHLLGYSIHFMNAAVIPMIIGIGIDDGIHIVHRTRRLWDRRAPAPGDPAAHVRGVMRVTGAAVMLTSLTTMGSFGSLALSRNLGIASLGVLCLLGVGAALLASLTVLPAALVVVGRRARGAPPDTGV